MLTFSVQWYALLWLYPLSIHSVEASMSLGTLSTSQQSKCQSQTNPLYFRLQSSSLLDFGKSRQLTLLEYRGEVNVAMIVGCLPAMQPLFKKVSKTAFMSIGSNSKTGSNNTSDEERLMRLKLKPSQYEALSGKKSQPMSQDFGPGYNAYGEPYGASANRNSLPQDPAHW